MKNFICDNCKTVFDYALVMGENETEVDVCPVCKGEEFHSLEKEIILTLEEVMGSLYGRGDLKYEFSKLADLHRNLNK